ncbi:MAG: (2Fe-2S) ferredoxin domain-containing protein [Rhodospirillaceae bacterium]|nr:(2Fe-2S) ferredoxin domain-containing protein [Rhodospirillaceae bacterium]
MKNKEKPNTLLVCVNRRLDQGMASCANRGSEEIAQALERGISERHIDITLEPICCLGHCSEGPNLRLAPCGSFFHDTTLDEVPNILDILETRCGLRSKTDPIPSEKRSSNKV